MFIFADDAKAVFLSQSYDQLSERVVKSSARWDMRQDKPNKEMEAVIVKTVASFLNPETGGTLLTVVEDNGTVLGLQHDYKTLSWSTPTARTPAR